ncbi:Uncharacterised protein [Vibrio cholerae]|nr:Uncharacterised protein [Vibrio cholerae]
MAWLSSSAAIARQDSFVNESRVSTVLISILPWVRVPVLSMTK